MIEIKQGNILDAKEDIIAHQVNCQGKFGAGLAKQIRIKYPFAYDTYMHNCESVESKGELLGTIKQCKQKDGKIIAHIYGQYTYGRGKKQTDYAALEKGLDKLKIKAKNFKQSVALPYGIGCGLAGGDWEEVHKIIDRVFADYKVTIYKL